MAALQDIKFKQKRRPFTRAVSSQPKSREAIVFTSEDLMRNKEHLYKISTSRLQKKGWEDDESKDSWGITSFRRKKHLEAEESGGTYIKSEENLKRESKLKGERRKIRSEKEEDKYVTIDGCSIIASTPRTSFPQNINNPNINTSNIAISDFCISQDSNSSAVNASNNPHNYLFPFQSAYLFPNFYQFSPPSKSNHQKQLTNPDFFKLLFNSKLFILKLEFIF